MPAFQGIAAPGAAVPSVHSRVLALPFGIHSSLTAGIPSNRVVFINNEARNTNGETITDNVSVGYLGTPGASGGTPFGVVIDGCSDAYSDLTLLPGINRDLNVTVCLLGTAMVQAAPGAVVASGTNPTFLSADGTLATPGAPGSAIASNWYVLRGTTGTGTATNPEFAVVLIR